MAITGDMEIAVYTEKFDRDNLCVLYLADSQWNYANVTLSMRNDATRESITPVVGYNFIKYANADRPFSMTFYPDADLYINGEQSVNNYGEWSGAADLEPNSVIKVFPQGTEVATYNVTIDNQSEGSIAILADYVTPLEGTQAGVFGPTDVEFVSVETAAAEGASAFIIKVNDEEIKANAQGKFVAHITADATISIEADQNVGITEITAGANDAIYNLQGVRVKNAKGGIFIRNGRKVVR